MDNWELLKTLDPLELLIAAVLIFFAASRARQKPPAAPGSVLDLATQEAAAAGFPLWLIAATGEVESRNRHLSSTGSGAGETFYPYGITVLRARDILPGYSDDYIREQLADLQAHTHMAATLLETVWSRYQGDEEALRLGWVVPAVAKRGRPWPEMTGSVATATRLANWKRAVEKWRGRPVA